MATYIFTVLSVISGLLAGLFGSEHWLKFCSFYDPVVQGYSDCGEYSDTDDNPAA